VEVSGSRENQLQQPWVGSEWSARMMAGLQAGVIAGLMTAAWLILENWRTGLSPWVAINLISTAVLGRSGWVIGFGGATLVGLSLHLFIAGLHGTVFAVMFSPRTRPFMAANAGLLFSFTSFAVQFIWILPRFAPMLARNAPRLQFAGAHFLMGMVLGLYPEFARGFLRKAPAPPPEPEPVLSAPPAPLPVQLEAAPDPAVGAQSTDPQSA
jgi:hypothetical protein